MNNIRLISMIDNFPIGGRTKSRVELLSKAEIVSFLSRFQEQFSVIEDVEEREAVVRQYLGQVLALNEGECIPSLSAAESFLGLSHGFFQDFGKVQLIRESCPHFDQTFDLLASEMNLVDTHSKSRH